MKRYVFEVVVNEGNNEFWEELEINHSSGCEDIREALRDSIAEGPGTMGFDFSIKLKEYKDIP